MSNIVFRSFPVNDHFEEAPAVQDALVSKIPLELVYRIFEYFEPADLQASAPLSKPWNEMVVVYAVDKELRFFNEFMARLIGQLNEDENEIKEKLNQKLEVKANIVGLKAIYSLKGETVEILCSISTSRLQDILKKFEGESIPQAWKSWNELLVQAQLHKMSAAIKQSGNWKEITDLADLAFKLGEVNFAKTMAREIPRKYQEKDLLLRTILESFISESNPLDIKVLMDFANMMHGDRNYALSDLAWDLAFVKNRVSDALEMAKYINDNCRMTYRIVMQLVFEKRMGEAIKVIATLPDELQRYCVLVDIIKNFVEENKSESEIEEHLNAFKDLIDRLISPGRIRNMAYDTLSRYLLIDDRLTEAKKIASHMILENAATKELLDLIKEIERELQNSKKLALQV